MRPALMTGFVWLDHIDPGAHRRIKGLRLVTAYGLAAMLGAMPAVAAGLANGPALSALAGGFALWGSVSEARSTRAESSRDLLFLTAAAALGAMVFAVLAPFLRETSAVGPEAVLASGAFCVGYLRRFGVTAAGAGSQIYIGQVLAYGAGLGPHDLPLILIAAVVAAIASIVPRVLSGPAEHPPAGATLPPQGGLLPPHLAMGLQAMVAALAVVGLNAAFGLVESAWAITASTYVVAGSASATTERVKRRIIGTVIGVPIGLAFLPLITTAPLVIWAVAALAIVIYAVALPDRYDVACGAYAVVLIVTLAIGGEHSIPILAARAWETLIGAALGLAAARLLFPLRPMQRL